MGNKPQLPCCSTAELSWRFRHASFEREAESFCAQLQELRNFTTYPPALISPLGVFRPCWWPYWASLAGLRAKSCRACPVHVSAVAAATSAVMLGRSIEKRLAKRFRSFIHARGASLAAAHTPRSSPHYRRHKVKVKDRAVRGVCGWGVILGHHYGVRTKTLVTPSCKLWCRQ